MRMMQIEVSKGRIYRYPLHWLALQIVTETPAKGKKRSSCTMKFRFLEPSGLAPPETDGQPMRRWCIEPEFEFDTAQEALEAVSIVEF